MFGVDLEERLAFDIYIEESVYEKKMFWYWSFATSCRQGILLIFKK